MILAILGTSFLSRQRDNTLTRRVRVLNLFTRSLTDGTAIYPELISIDFKLQSHYMGPFVNTSIQIVDDLLLFRISAVQGAAAEVFILHWPTGTIRSVRLVLGNLIQPR